MPNHKRLKFFDKDHIEWTGKYELHDFYKTLIALKRDNPALAAGYIKSETYLIGTNHPQQVLSFIRKKDQQQVVVLLNLSREPVTVELQHELLTGSYKNIFSGEATDLSAMHRVHMNAGGYLVFEK
jgi:glycosidase